MASPLSHGAWRGSTGGGNFRKYSGVLCLRVQDLGFRGLGFRVVEGPKYLYGTM